jgi:hypothetical protein
MGCRALFAPLRPRNFSVAMLVMAAVIPTWSRRAHAEPGDEFIISVLTFGPGDHPFSRFGHDGLLVEDRALGTSLVYNYGTYSFHSAWLIPKFLLGKYRYWLSVSPLPSVVASYAAENRSVTQQRLALPAAQKKSLVEFLVWNAREENKYYLFDYYRDNCATRVRDLIEVTTDGALHAANAGPASLTWREHTERLAADDPLVYFGLDLAMGGFVDQPIAFWHEMFLPAKLEEGLRRAVIMTPDASGSPSLAKLVDAEAVLVPNRRPPLRESPPHWTKQLLGVGSIAALLMVGLAWGAYLGSRGARIAVGAFIALLGLVLGCLGCLFLFLWLFTNHEVAYRNENLWQCVPFALVLAWQGAALARGRPGSAGRAHRTALVGLGFSGAGLVLKSLPWFDQHNGHLIAFFFPLWTGVALATRVAAREGGEGLGGDGDRLAEAQARGVERT